MRRIPLLPSLVPKRSLRLGILTALVLVAVTTGAIYALREAVPVATTGVVYLLAVLVVSTYWGMGLGLATSFLSATAWNFFHFSPVHTFRLADEGNWIVLAVFVFAGVFASALAQAARSRAEEGDRRRREADLVAELAQALVASRSVDEARGTVARRLTTALGLESASVEMRGAPASDRQVDIALRTDDERVGTLLVPRDTAASSLESLRRMGPSLAALLAAARRRDALERELVETESLRRSDVLKTALLRAVSHDLRSPLTAIAAAAGGLEDAEGAAVAELASVIKAESDRLSRLVDDLLDLSRLETGRAQPRIDWCSLEEVIGSAVASLPDGGSPVELTLEDGLPLVQADAGQLERALANLLENARRHGHGEPVTVQVRRAQHRLRIRVTDRGPGIPAEQRDRVFEPFFRGEGARRGGSGLGLAIARGFVEANGGRLWVESLPGQGASFVIELPQRVRPRETVGL